MMETERRMPDELIIRSLFQGGAAVGHGRYLAAALQIAANRVPGK